MDEIAVSSSIQVEPAGHLRFGLEAGMDSISNFKITNTSRTQAVVFKVRDHLQPTWAHTELVANPQTQTTKPSRYQVRPSTGLLDVAGHPRACCYVTVLLKVD
jgi:hypothetical protein